MSFYSLFTSPTIYPKEITMSTATTINASAANAIAANASASAATEVDPIRTIRTDNCPSLSERSTLTYCIGCNDKAEILLRVCGNTGAGFFNAEWVSLQDVQDVVDAVPEGFPITSSTFRSIYAGKSNNSSGFLLAVLKHLGLASAHADAVRGYEFHDSASFMAEMGELIAELPALEIVKKSAKAKSKKAQADTSVDANTGVGVDPSADAANA